MSNRKSWGKGSKMTDAKPAPDPATCDHDWIENGIACRRGGLPSLRLFFCFKCKARKSVEAVQKIVAHD